MSMMYLVKPLSCPDQVKLGQKGFAPIIILIVIAAFGAGILGPVVYPQVKLQVEQIIKQKPQPPAETATESEEETATESAEEVSEEESADKSQTGAINIKVETNIAQESKESEAKQKVVIEDEENKAKGTGKKDEQEQGQKKEGIEDEPPIDLPFTVLDFSKLSGLIAQLSTPTPTPFIKNYLGKIKLLPGLTQSLTPTPQPTPAPPKKAIVVTLDKVKIHDDEDPGPLNGEVQIMASVRTGFTEQVNAWPYKNWDEADSGNTLNVNQPIFVLPKDSVDEKLAIWISVLENDGLPKSAPKLIKKSLKISEGSALLYADPATFLASYALEKATDKFLDWLGSEEHIGTLTTALYKSQNFGMGDGSEKSYTVRKKNATITYTVREVTIPEKPLRVEIKVKKVKVGESGDIWPNDGDLFIWTYVSDGFDGKEPHGMPTRIPKKGTHTKEDDATWNVDREIFSGKITGPLVYYEIGVWDGDPKPSNDDQLEIVSDTIYLSDHKAGDVIKESKDGDDGVDASAKIYREIRFYAAD